MIFFYDFMISRCTIVDLSIPLDVGFVPITGKPVFRPKLSAENPAGNVTGKLKFPAEIFRMKLKRFLLEIHNFQKSISIANEKS